MLELMKQSSVLRNLKKKLIQTIMANKGDGLDLEIHSGNSGIYIDIDLLVGEEDDESRTQNKQIKIAIM